MGEVSMNCSAAHAPGTRRSIPGTPVFDGAAAQLGYPLNAMCYSFNEAANREAFRAD